MKTIEVEALGDGDYTTRGGPSEGEDFPKGTECIVIDKKTWKRLKKFFDDMPFSIEDFVE
jgi:hypothetical protein